MFTLKDYKLRKFGHVEPLKQQSHFNTTTQPLNYGESFTGKIEEVGSGDVLIFPSLLTRMEMLF